MVISFDENPDYQEGESDSLRGGIAGESAALIKNTFPSLGNNASSYFAYKKMEMFVHGGDPVTNQSCDWCDTDTSVVDLLFRIGKDDNNYYEIQQPIYEGWNDKNHIDINIDNLTQLKIPTIESPSEILLDFGLDGCKDDFENGFGGCLDTLTFNYYCTNLDSLPQDSIINVINIDHCVDQIPSEDPNSDNWNDCGTDTICPQDDNYFSPDADGSEDNDIWDENEGVDGNNKYDQFDINGDGLISFGEGEPAVEDYNGDGIYTPHASYDYENELYFWDKTEDIRDACGNCTQLKVNGTPSFSFHQEHPLQGHSQRYQYLHAQELRPPPVHSELR